MIAPVIIVWAAEGKKDIRSDRVFELVIFSVILIGTGAYCLKLLPLKSMIHLPLFSLAPILIWSAFRLGQCVTFSAVLLIAGMSAVATAVGQGPFSGKELNISLMELQWFMAVISTTIFIMSGVITEWLFSVEALQKAHNELELRVEERTTELVKTNENFKREINERERVEEELEEHRERLEELVEQRTAELQKSESSFAEAQRIVHIGNWDWNLQTNELLWSDEIYRIYGFAPQEFGATYEAFLSSVHPEDRDYLKKAVDKTLKDRKPYNIEHRIVRPDGEVRIVYEQAELTLDRSEKPVRMLGTVQDITERKKAEEELEKHREHLEDLVRERTAELQVMVNAMAGREIRMSELKQVIEKLHAQIESEGLTPVANDPIREAGKDYT